MKTFAFYIGLFALLGSSAMTNAFAATLTPANCGGDPTVAVTHISDGTKSATDPQYSWCSCAIDGHTVAPSNISSCTPVPACPNGHHMGTQSGDETYVAGQPDGNPAYYHLCVCDVQNPKIPSEHGSTYAIADAATVCPALPVVAPAPTPAAPTAINCGTQGTASTTEPGRCVCIQADSSNQNDSYAPNSGYVCPSPPACGAQGTPLGKTAFCTCTNGGATYAAGNGATACPATSGGSGGSTSSSTSSTSTSSGGSTSSTVTCGPGLTKPGVTNVPGIPAAQAAAGCGCLIGTFSPGWGYISYTASTYPYCNMGQVSSTSSTSSSSSSASTSSTSTSSTSTSGSTQPCIYTDVHGNAKTMSYSTTDTASAIYGTTCQTNCLAPASVNNSKGTWPSNYNCVYKCNSGYKPDSASSGNNCIPSTTSTLNCGSLATQQGAGCVCNYGGSFSSAGGCLSAPNCGAYGYPYVGTNQMCSCTNVDAQGFHDTYAPASGGASCPGTCPAGLIPNGTTPFINDTTTTISSQFACGCSLSAPPAGQALHYGVSSTGTSGPATLGCYYKSICPSQSTWSTTAGVCLCQDGNPPVNGTCTRQQLMCGETDTYTYATCNNSTTGLAGDGQQQTEVRTSTCPGVTLTNVVTCTPCGPTQIANLHTPYFPACVNCPPTQSNVNGACGCTSTQDLVGGLCVGKCPTGATRDNNGICQCPAGQGASSSNSCQACTGNTIGASALCQACPTGMVANSTHTQCVTSTTTSSTSGTSSTSSTSGGPPPPMCTATVSYANGYSTVMLAGPNGGKIGNSPYQAAGNYCTNAMSIPAVMAAEVTYESTATGSNVCAGFNNVKGPGCN